MAEAADTEEKKLEPKAKVEEVGPCKLKLQIEITQEKVQEQIDGKYKELSDSVALPGFRKGHAPRNLLERKFGKAVLDDLKFEILHQAFEEVKEEKKLEPIGEPDIDVEKLAVEEGKPFAFEFTIEVRPQIEVKSYEGLKVRKPAIEVDEKEIETVLERFQESKAELVPAEDGKAKEGDQVICDFALSAEGKQIDTAENNALFLTPDVNFYGQQLPEFHKTVAGHKIGDKVKVTVRLPDTFAEKAYAGKDAELEATIKSVKRKKLPEIDAEFAKQFDMDSLDEFREDIRKRISREKESHSRGHMAEELVEQLIKANTFAMPEGLIASGTEEALQRLHLDLAVQGKEEAEIQKTLEKEKGKSREGMEKAMRAHFILEHIAQKEKIFVTEDQIEERIGQLAAQYGKWPHEMKGYLEQQGLISQLRRSMREELVREFLLSKAVIEEEGKKS